jgi:peroxiredoxin
MSRYLAALFIMMSYSVECRAQDFPYSNPDSLIKSIEGNILRAKGKKAPRLEFTNIETNAQQYLTDCLGKTALLKFWYRGRRGCEEDMHVVSKLQDDYDEQGLVVIYIDCEGTLDDANRFFDARMADGNPFHGVKGLVDRDSLVAPFEGIVAPMTLVIDRAGIIRDGWVGTAKYERFESSILPFVPKAPVKWQRIMLVILLLIVAWMLFMYRARLRNLLKW